MQQLPQPADSQQAAVPQHYPAHSNGSGFSMPWLNQMGYGIPGLPHWPTSMPESSTQRVASGILGWGNDNGAPWGPPAQSAPVWQHHNQQQQPSAAPDAQQLQRQASAHQPAALQRAHDLQHQQHAQHSAPTRLLNGGPPPPQEQQQQQQQRQHQHQQCQAQSHDGAAPSRGGAQRRSPLANGGMPPPEPPHRADTGPSRGDTGGAARIPGSSGSRPIRPQPRSFSGSLSATARGAQRFSAEEVSAAISREFGHSLADHNQEGSATSDEVHHPKLIPRAGAGPKLRQSGDQIDEYLMRLLRVGAANEAEARLYAQGKRVALVTQPPHQADDHRRNSDAGSQKAAVQQLTAIVGAAPQLPSPQQPQQQQQSQPQQVAQQQVTQQQAPQARLEQQPAADGRPPPPLQRRPSSRQLLLPPPTTEPTTPNSVGSQHAKVSSSRSRSRGNVHVTGEDVADSAAAARGARGAVSLTPSRGNPASRHPREAGAGSSGSDRPAISEWRGEARLTESAAGRGDGRGPLRPPSRAWASASAAAPPPEDQSPTAAAESANGQEQRGCEDHEQLERGPEMLRHHQQQQQFSSGCLPKAALLSENLIGFRPPAIGSRANSGTGGEASGDGSRPPRSLTNPRLSCAPQQQQSRRAVAQQQQQQRQQAAGITPPALQLVKPERQSAAAVHPAAAGAMVLLGWRGYTSIRKVMQMQAAEFTRQLSELHRLASVQHQLAVSHQQQQQQQPWPAQPMPPRPAPQMPWLGPGQMPGFVGMPLVPMISAWDPMAAWYSPQAAPGMMPGAFGMMPGAVNPMAMQIGLQTAGSGMMPPPGVMPPMGWPGAGVMPQMPGSGPMVLGPQVGPPPAAAWFTPLQVQPYGGQPAGSMAPAAYGSMHMPAQGGAMMMPPLLGLPAGMAAMPYPMMAAAAGRHTPALQQAGDSQAVGMTPPLPATQHEKRRQRPSNVQDAAAQGHDTLQLAAAPQTELEDVQAPKRQRVGGT